MSEVERVNFVWDEANMMVKLEAAEREANLLALIRGEIVRCPRNHRAWDQAARRILELVRKGEG